MPYRLPESIYNSSQLRQLQSELKRLRSLRNPKNLVFSSNLQELAAANNIKKLNITTTSDLLKYVNVCLDQSVEITMNLASQPSIEERDELVARLRRMFSKTLLVHFIIQPELLAGATIRTKNNFFDLSLRNALFANKAKLVQRVKNGWEQNIYQGY